jgi:hypothetical protein
MTFIERTRLFESASWHFKSHQDQLFCSVFAVERVLTPRQWGVFLHRFIILCIAMVKGLPSEVEVRLK